jgi:hypothetical protein
MATDTDTITQEQEITAVAEMSNSKLFEWNAWVHVGQGVNDCELTKALADPERERTKPLPTCDDPEHFHAWVRLPNPLQRRDIVDKAQAARARKMRELRDPESDAAVILEDDIAQITEDMREDILEEIVARSFSEDQVKATSEVLEIDSDEEPGEDGEIPKLYGLIDQDIEELERLEAMPEAERDEDALTRLRAHVDAYDKAVGERTTELQDARRVALRELPLEQVIDRVRKDRQEWVASEAQMAAYQNWQMLVCTLKPRKSGTPQERVWGDINDMRFNAPPEALTAVRETLTRLGDTWAGSLGKG